MNATLHLTKLTATGNDFLAVAALDGLDPIDATLARALCDRRRGIGADGIMTLAPARSGSAADCRMVLRNADGGLAQMSGNGIRCLAAVAVRHGLGTHDRLAVDTDAGERVLALTRDGDGRLVSAQVDMGAATFEPSAIPLAAPSPFDLELRIEDLDLRGDAVGMGNPHLVVPVADVDAVALDRIGPALEHDSRFPDRTNVAIVAPAGASTLRMRVWERGVGETLSCGTGACATAAAAHRRGLVGDVVRVLVPGGELTVAIGATILLGGPVVAVAEVVVQRDDLERAAR